MACVSCSRSLAWVVVVMLSPLRPHKLSCVLSAFLRAVCWVCFWSLPLSVFWTLSGLLASPDVPSGSLLALAVPPGLSCCSPPAFLLPARCLAVVRLWPAM